MRTKWPQKDTKQQGRQPSIVLKRTILLLKGLVSIKYRLSYTAIRTNFGLDRNQFTTLHAILFFFCFHLDLVWRRNGNSPPIMDKIMELN